MRRPKIQPTNFRNGLKWRDGRPRWEPSPASRAAGLRGVDLKDLEGAWITERGTAIAICDARTLWAKMIREAASGGVVGDHSGGLLRRALDALPQAVEPAARLRRSLIQDLLDAAEALLSGQDAAAGVSLSRGPRTVERLVEAYFHAVDTGEVEIAASSRQAYWSQRTRLIARFGARPVASITRGELHDWYHKELRRELSPSTANLCMGSTAAIMAYAERKGWIAATPATRLDIKKAEGRRVFWTMAEEQAFVAWCDANGYADVADAVVMGLWTGARPVDMCRANLEDLAKDVWRYTPLKTQRKGQEAMPAIMDPLRERIERRSRAAQSGAVRHLGATPFLFDFRTERRHTVGTLRDRFKTAQAVALAREEVPVSFNGKRMQDTRDTCITRLWEAGVPPARMWPWTGHSQKSIEEILREHYIVLREEGMAELATKLKAWAEQEKVALQ